jgi:hypothetical protein
MLVVGAIPLAILHLFQRQVEAWEDDFLVKYGTTRVTYAVTGIIDFLARHPVWSIFLFALCLLLGLLAHAYISTHPFNEFEKGDSPETDPKGVAASSVVRNDVMKVPAAIHVPDSALTAPRLARDANAEWKELAARFEKLPNGIRADSQIDRKNQKTTYDLWTLHGDRNGHWGLAHPFPH